MPRTTTLPTWDLRDLFTSDTDPNVDKTLADLERRAKRFSKTYRAIFKPSLAAKTLLRTIRDYENILQDLTKPEVFAYLRFTTDSTDQKVGAFFQKIKTRTVAIGQDLLFFELGIASLPDKTLNKLVKDKQLKPYRHYLDLQIKLKEHRLSEPEEKILNDMSLTGHSAFVRLYDEELGAKKFISRQQKKEQVKTEEEMLHMLHAPERAIRKQAAKDFTLGLQEESRRLTYITNTLLQDKRTTDRYRRFSTPEAARHLDNEITQDVVDAMTKAVTERYRSVHDYYRFKAQVMKLKPLYDYDRYAPLPSAKATYSFDEAKHIILDAYTRFSPKLAEEVKTFFDNNWIDAAPKHGKRGGAYCMFVTPDLHPYVFMNFQGSANDVMTLAHELGHAAHASLARKQSYLNFSMPLTVAETASVFGEMLVFDALREQLTGQDRFALIMQKVESIFATVHRQTSMYLFEKDLHAASTKRGELSTSDINAIWRKRQVEMFGTSVTLTSDYDIWWSYVSHFVHSPFYVYAYAFGELLTLSLFAQYKKDGPAMAEKYLTMLQNGGSITPQEMVAPFGFDLSDPNFWRGGMKLIEELIKDAKRSYKK
jgi:oligoendopeptidase F